MCRVSSLRMLVCYTVILTRQPPWAIARIFDMAYYGTPKDPTQDHAMPSLRPSQKTAASAISPISQLLLADVGAGKTATALQAIRQRRIVNGKQRVLVLGTLRICNTVWEQETAAWTPELTYASVAGKTESERKRIMESDCDIVGLNFDNLIWAVESYGEILPRLFHWLVIDECSKLENPASKSFRAIKPLLPLFEWRLPMTGTPRANHLYDLWGSVYLADIGESLGNYRGAFLQKWFYAVKRKVGIDYVPRWNAEDEIYNRIKGLVHRMPFEWQPPIEIDVILPLNPAVDKIQKEIDASLKNEVEKVALNGITFVRRGTRVHTKFLQLASGCIYDDKDEVVVIHQDKLDALAEIITEAKGEPVMVVFQYDHERDTIRGRFQDALVMDSDETLAEWNEGKINLLLVHPLSCGHGVNAQFSGSSLQIWYTPTADAELYTQTVGRMNRPGNNKTVRVMRLIMKGTKDQETYLIVAARQHSEVKTLGLFK